MRHFKEFELTFNKETIDRFGTYLESAIYLKGQNLTEHWDNAHQENIKAFSLEGNNIFVRLNYKPGCFDRIDMSQNFATPKKNYISKIFDSSETVISFAESKLRTLRRIILRRLSCNIGIAYDPLYHFG